MRKKEFRLKANSGLLNYTFDQDKSIVFQKLKGLPEQLQTSNVKNEFDLAKAWADFAKMSVEDSDFPETSMPIWNGHYEQFGRVMLELVRISRDREKHKGKGFYSTIPLLEDISFMGEPSGTEDRTFYRIWLNFIGHPEHQHPHINNIEAATYAWWGLLMTWAFSQVERLLYEQED